ncbi:MAG: GNAT family N-acetyltransferase [Bacteroidales bacterium]|nr:GNAT family N-acetyltransferase [Bacteroidales bacterium]
MIRFLKHSEIDPEKWNRAVHNSLYSTIFAEFEMLNKLTAPDSWNALVSQDYEAVMPLPTRKKGVLKYVYSPFFLPQMGIFSEHEITPQKTADFLHEISRHYVLADVLMNEKTESGHWKHEFVSHSLSLHIAYNELYSQFHENTKRNIKAAQKLQSRVTVQEEKIADIIALFRTNKGSEEAVHFRENDYARLQQVADYLLEHNLLEVYGVRTSDDKLAAGALFMKDGKRRWFWFSGRNNQLSESKPMFLLLDTYIRNHAESDLYLDFNGSSNPNVARLYQGFDGKRYTIPFVRQFKNRFWKMVLSPFIDNIR